MDQSINDGRRGGLVPMQHLQTDPESQLNGRPSPPSRTTPPVVAGLSGALASCLDFVDMTNVPKCYKVSRRIDRSGSS